jgi:hypothetical protein
MAWKSQRSKSGPNFKSSLSSNTTAPVSDACAAFLRRDAMPSKAGSVAPLGDTAATRVYQSRQQTVRTCRAWIIGRGWVRAWSSRCRHASRSKRPAPRPPGTKGCSGHTSYRRALQPSPLFPRRHLWARNCRLPKRRFSPRALGLLRSFPGAPFLGASPALSFCNYRLGSRVDNFVRPAETARYVPRQAVASQERSGLL